MSQDLVWVEGWSAAHEFLQLPLREDEIAYLEASGRCEKCQHLRVFHDDERPWDCHIPGCPCWWKLEGPVHEP